MADEQNIDRLIARLLLCTKRRRRPFSLVEIAEDLKIAIAQLGSLDAVADRVGISISMLKRFLLVDRLEIPLKEMVQKRVLDSVDAVAELSGLTEVQQIAVAEVLTRNTFDTEDIRGIVRLLNRNADLGLEAIVEKVKSSKTKRVYVYEFIPREGTKDPERIRACLLAHLSESDILDVQAGLGVGRIKLSAEGKKKISQIARERKVRIAGVISNLLEGNYGRAN